MDEVQEHMVQRDALGPGGHVSWQDGGYVAAVGRLQERVEGDEFHYVVGEGGGGEEEGGEAQGCGGGVGHCWRVGVWIDGGAVIRVR